MGWVPSWDTLANHKFSSLLVSIWCSRHRRLHCTVEIFLQLLSYSPFSHLIGYRLEYRPKGRERTTDVNSLNLENSKHLKEMHSIKLFLFMVTILNRACCRLLIRQFSCMQVAQFLHRHVGLEFGADAVITNGRVSFLCFALRLFKEGIT